jgi:hypothetical protein
VSGKKRCLFCGSTGLTREHVIAKWLRQELRTQGWVYEQRGTGKARKWNALAVVLPRVCHRCNNELLADLEDRAKPILGPLLHGGSGSAPILIDPSQQATLATWAVKTSLLLTIRSFEGEAAGWFRPTTSSGFTITVARTSHRPARMFGCSESMPRTRWPRRHRRHA